MRFHRRRCWRGSDGALRDGGSEPVWLLQLIRSLPPHGSLSHGRGDGGNVSGLDPRRGESLRLWPGI
jgi:hypothetical protein